MRSVFTPGRYRAARWSRQPAAVTAVAAGTALLGSALLPGLSVSAARASAPALAADPAALVNPFIGTAGQGHTLPGATVPFGMVQWSPDTPSRPYGSGYSYGDSSITGFSLTHMSGAGCLVAGDIPVLPTMGRVRPGAQDRFAHARELAAAGYYRVRFRNGITTALTATARTGMARFTFPSTTRANLIFRLSGSQRPDSATTFRVISRTQVQGSATSVNFCGIGTSYTLHFDMQFSQPFTAHGTYTAAGRRRGAGHLAARQTHAATAGPVISSGVPEQAGHPVYHGSLPRGQALPAPALTRAHGAWLTFRTTRHRTVTAKVGISYVSAANARANLAAENPRWNFTATRHAATAAWNRLLSRVQVGGGSTGQQQVFYTALYHSLLHPNVFSDRNGQYPGVDGEVHAVDAGHSAFYTNFSGWDIYRTQAQLEALVAPQAASDTAQSMVDDYAQGGTLPKWTADSGESYIMIGDPADAILADYHAFGATNFDASAALADMIAEATKPGRIRPGLGYLTRLGYLPENGRYGCCNYYDAVSTTLEYNTADFAISALAGALGRTAVQHSFANRAQDWRHVLNPASGFVQPRNADGTWTAGFDPVSQAGLAESGSWVYTGMVPFNLAGLARAKGGAAAMAAYLGTVLRSFTGAAGYAYLGNEPSLGLPWEYDYIGQPGKTQQTIRRIQDQLWVDTPSGLPGNDDLGTMSAWYVWSVLGMYPMTPGTADLALGSPVFPRALVTLPSGATLTINGNGAAGNAPYVQSATWNDSAWTNAYAPTSAITSGGTLSYTLGTRPGTAWATAPAQAPPSYPGSVAPAARPRTGPVTSAVSSRLCLNVRRSATADGTPVQVATCNGTGAQEWTVAPDGTIRALGKCLSAGRGATSGPRIALSACARTRDQRWAARPGGTLANPASRLCLTNPGTGAQVRLGRCVATRARRWNLPAAAGHRARHP